jgi:tetratricopeptide (TPR) repeat protein
MMRRISQGALVAGMLLALSCRALLADTAQEAQTPIVDVMACQSACANFTPQKPIRHDLPDFPRSVDGPFDPGADGFMKLFYTIGTDGKVRDVVPIYNVGPRPFVDKSIEAVKAWTFEPAKIDGKPAEKSIMLDLTYEAARPGGAHLDLNAIYKETAALRQAGKTDEARAKLEQIFAMPQLNLFERSALALPLAQLATERKDYLEASRILMMGTIKSQYMPAAAAPLLWRLRVSVDLYLGEIVDALASGYWMAQVRGTDPIAFNKFLIDTRAKIDAMPELSVQARIPDGPEGNVYVHVLYRRSFAFQAQPGALDHFVLDCSERLLQSKIALTAQWHVPESWSNCGIYVYGKPGATFTLVETNDSQAEKDQQMASYDAAVKAGPTSAAAFLARGRAYQSRGHEKEAIADYDKAIALDPNLIDAHLARVDLRILAGDLGGAIADCDAVLKLVPKNPPALYKRAFAYRAEGAYEKALGDYDTLVRSKDAGAYFNRGIVLFCLGRYIDATFDFLKNRELTGNSLENDIWLHVIYAHRGQDDQKGSWDYLARMPDAHWSRRIAGLQMGGLSLDKVAPEFDAWQKNPTDKSYWTCNAQFFIAEYQLEHGDTNNARERLMGMTAQTCPFAESAAAVAELKRLAGK